MGQGGLTGLEHHGEDRRFHLVKRARLRIFGQVLLHLVDNRLECRYTSLGLGHRFTLPLGNLVALITCRSSQETLLFRNSSLVRNPLLLSHSDRPHPRDFRVRNSCLTCSAQKDYYLRDHCSQIIYRQQMQPLMRVHNEESSLCSFTSWSRRVAGITGIGDYKWIYK